MVFSLGGRRHPFYIDKFTTILATFYTQRTSFTLTTADGLGDFVRRINVRQANIWLVKRLQLTINVFSSQRAGRVTLEMRNTRQTFHRY